MLKLLAQIPTHGGPKTATFAGVRLSNWCLHKRNSQFPTCCYIQIREYLICIALCHMSTCPHGLIVTYRFLLHWTYWTNHVCVEFLKLEFIGIPSSWVQMSFPSGFLRFSSERSSAVGTVSRSSGDTRPGAFRGLCKTKAWRIVTRCDPPAGPPIAKVCQAKWWNLTIVLFKSSNGPGFESMESFGQTYLTYLWSEQSEQIMVFSLVLIGVSVCCRARWPVDSWLSEQQRCAAGKARAGRKGDPTRCQSMNASSNG